MTEDSHRVHVGISTCPNDTFAFHAILNNLIDLRGLEFVIALADVQELNERLCHGEFDVAKASFHAAIRLSEETIVLPSGSALGYGVGPLLLSRHDGTEPDDNSESFVGSGSRALVLCPGENTTATMLYHLFFPDHGEIEQVVFSDIMPRLESGTADFGVCIHEGRFTWRESGLFLVADLGELWESKTGLPLPLGGIIGRRNVPVERLATIQEVIQESIEYGLRNRDDTLPTMRKYAQEFSDEVLFSHVDLYVNSSTVFMDETGRLALKRLSELARDVGLVSRGSRNLEVLRAGRR